MPTLTMVVNIAPECEYDTLMPIEDICRLCSPDEEYNDHEGSGYQDGEVGATLANKRKDEGYEALREDMRQHGVKTPLYVPGSWLNNGHHRVAAAVDLGMTHMPVTGDGDLAWSGPDWTDATYSRSGRDW